MGEVSPSLPTRQLVSIAMATLFVLWPGMEASAEDDVYLKALKAEADSSESTQEQPAETEGRSPERTDDQPQMEAWLKKNYVGSYAFYRRLSEAKRKAVYRVYRAGGEISEIREKINELLKQ